MSLVSLAYEMKRSFGNPGEMEGFRTIAAQFYWRHPRWQAVILCFGSLILTTTMLPQASADLTNDTATLLKIKQAWGNPVALSTWQTNFNTCSEWQFVTCDSRNTTVTKLSIFETGAVNVNSELPESLGDLVNLNTLIVSGWGLIGPIPSSIGLLKNLTILNLESNYLSGTIPPEIGQLTELTVLDLGINNISGPLPVQLSALQQLNSLWLNTNQLTGVIPSWMGSFPMLSFLYLDSNLFVGNIPPEMGNLSSLQVLQLTASGVSGTVPSQLGKLTSLIDLNLDSNSLTGTIPDSIGNLKSLQSLGLSQCSFNGTIPSSLRNLNQLTSLDLSVNRLSGLIPTQLSALSNLTYLNLHGNLLDGPIPTQFSQLSKLLTLDLSSNRLGGPIPQAVVRLPQLQQLTLEDNCLNGTVPAYNKNNSLTFNFGTTDNSNCFNATQFCKCAVSQSLSPSPSLLPETGGDNGVSNTANKVYIAIGVIAGSLLVLMGLLLLCFCRHKKQPRVFNTGSMVYKGPVRQYSLAEVKEATNNFNTKIGEGAFATVYKAQFKNNMTAAVKRFNKRRPVESFEKEVEHFSHLNHRFLVNLVGYCEDSEEGEHMLLYEFMDRGNLLENLHGRRDKGPIVPLTWDERVKVVISVAHGIDYLHYGTSPPLIHRDIKSANILLTSSGNSLIAKVADFGLGRQTVIDGDEIMGTFGHEPPKPFPTQIAGTPGYFDPDYLNTSILSPGADVYSYGVVLLELITGRLPILEKERETLAQWAKPFLDKEEISKIIDPKLEKGSFDEEHLRAVAELGRRCIITDTRQRPTIRVVVETLTQLFRDETRMVNPSLRAPSSLRFSDSANFLGENHNRILNVSSESIREASMNYTQSEILPRE